MRVGTKCHACTRVRNAMQNVHKLNFLGLRNYILKPSMKTKLFVLKPGMKTKLFVLCLLSVMTYVSTTYVDVHDTC